MINKYPSSIQENGVGVKRVAPSASPKDGEGLKTKKAGLAPMNIILWVNSPFIL